MVMISRIWKINFEAMFTVLDYSIFCVSIIVSMCIGLYFGYWKKAQSTDDYLLGNRSMKLVPVGLSMIASQVSGIALLVFPADVYVYGANVLWMCVSITLACLITCYVYLPVIAKLRAPSIYQYIELRFNRSTKVIASCVYTLHIIIFNSVVTYISSISFSQVSGINPHIISTIVCGICIIYTTIGGFKAVIWTDIVQLGVMAVGLFAVFILGIVSAGGVNAIYDKAMRGHRLDFNFSIDMTIRDGFWQVLLGSLIIWIYNLTFYAGAVQKYISLSSISNIKKAAIMFSSGSVAFHLIGILIGIMVYAKYSGCDPLTSGQVSRPDQIIPFFVTENGQSVPGLSGIFIAALFSSGLSTLSSTLNTLAATIYGDFISPFFSEGVLVPKEGYILKLIVVLTGITCTSLSFFIDRIGSMAGFIVSLLGLTFGLSTGLFSLGMLFPRANSKGALGGLFSSFFVVGTITILNQWYTLQGAIQSFAKPMSVDGCQFPINITSSKPNNLEPPFILFRLSFWYSPVMSFLIVIIVGLLVSWFTKGDSEFIDPDLISPISRSAITQVKSGDNNLEEYSGGTLCFDKTTYNFEDSARI